MVIVWNKNTEIAIYMFYSITSSFFQAKSMLES